MAAIAGKKPIHLDSGVNTQLVTGSILLASQVEPFDDTDTLEVGRLGDGINMGKSGSLTHVFGPLTVEEDVNVEGDLFVQGNSVALDLSSLLIEDNIIVVNSAPTIIDRDGGLLVQRYQQDNDAGTGNVVNDSALATFSLGDQSGATATEVILPAGASAVDDFYTNWWVKVTSGLSNNQTRKITGYVGATRTATVSSAWTTQNPSSGDTVSLYGLPFVGLIFDESAITFQLLATDSDPEANPINTTALLNLTLSALSAQNGVTFGSANDTRTASLSRISTVPTFELTEALSQTSFASFVADWDEATAGDSENNVGYISAIESSSDTPDGNFALIGFAATNDYSGGGALEYWTGYTGRVIALNAGGSINEATMYTMEDANIGGSITTQYGIKIPRLTAGDSNLAFHSDLFEGSVIDLSADGALSLTDSLTGIHVDLGTNVTQNAQTVTGMYLNMPSPTDAAINIAQGSIGLASQSTLISPDEWRMTIPPTALTANDLGLSLNADSSVLVSYSNSALRDNEYLLGYAYKGGISGGAPPGVNYRIYAYGAAPQHLTTGTVQELGGLVFRPTSSGAGTITTRSVGLRVEDGVIGGGVIDTQYGVYVDRLSAGTSNTAFHSDLFTGTIVDLSADSPLVLTGETTLIEMDLSNVDPDGNVVTGLNITLPSGGEGTGIQVYRDFGTGISITPEFFNLSQAPLNNVTEFHPLGAVAISHIINWTDSAMGTVQAGYGFKGAITDTTPASEFHGFISAPYYNAGSGTMPEQGGFYAYIRANGGCEITEAVGFTMDDALVANGSIIANQYGVRIPRLTAATNLNFAFHSDVFPQGQIIDISADSVVTSTGDIYGVVIDLETAVTNGGHTITGLYSGVPSGDIALTAVGNVNTFLRPTERVTIDADISDFASAGNGALTINFGTGANIVSAFKINVNHTGGRSGCRIIDIAQSSASNLAAAEWITMIGIDPNAAGGDDVTSDRYGIYLFDPGSAGDATKTALRVQQNWTEAMRIDQQIPIVWENEAQIDFDTTTMKTYTEVQTTNATPTPAALISTLNLDGTVFMVTADVVAVMDDGTECAGITVKATFRRAMGTTTKVGTTTTVHNQQDNAWTVDIGLFVTDIQVEVTGELGKTIDWKVRTTVDTFTT